MLSKAGKHYGESIIKEYSIKLINEVGRKYNETTLKRMRQFYLIIEKGATMSHQLTWSHYVELLPIKEIKIINYYIKKCEINNINIRTLRSIIKSKEYERLPKETKDKLLNLRKITQDKTIGIIICKKDNKFVMEYCSDERLTIKSQ